MIHEVNVHTVRARLADLDVETKAVLTAGTGMWSIPGIPEAGVPPITVTDGPNGARGSALLGAGRVTAACLPCGSALGATWDGELVERLGRMLGQEARTKGCRVLLAPTINLHRSPTAGRNFECYSEDPLLSGRSAAAFVRGVQAEGVAATPKHLVGNEAEFERSTMSSDIGERALRELYLVPFELAVRDGAVWAVMTGYNRLNGRYCAEDRRLLTEVLRGEFGFTGIVMTDWFAAASTVEAALAGLDLQMPGPDRFYGRALAAAVEGGLVPRDVFDAIIDRWLLLIDRLGAWSDPATVTETAVDLPEHRALAREASSSSMVLLRNEGVLPLDPAVGSVALIGPNAGWGHIMGGGSAQLKPHYRVAPIEVLRERLGDRLVHQAGCIIDKAVRPLGRPRVFTPEGEPGVRVEYFATPDWSGRAVDTEVVPDLRLLMFGSPVVDAAAGNKFSMRARCSFRAETAGTHTFTLMQAGHARVLLDGLAVIDGIAAPPPGGTELFGLASEEVAATIALEAGQEVRCEVEYTSADSVYLHGVKVGYRPPDVDDAIDRAVAAATACEVAVVVVGTSDEWESEGRDRESMHLPGDQDELVRRVCAANARTVVVVNAGTMVAMDWADDAGAIVQCWLGGQEMAASLDEVLFGEAEPAGRLPFTIPLREEHGPAFGTFPGANDHLLYGEDLLVGYRWFETRRLPVRYPFGHGGSYTTFVWGEPRLSTRSPLGVEVEVRNTGHRRGAEVVQCYVSPPPCRLYRPRTELKGYAKLWLDPGESAVAAIDLDARSFAYWDPGSTDRDDIEEKLGDSRDLLIAAHGPQPRRVPGWYVDAGTYQVQIGRSVADVAGSVAIQLAAAGPLSIRHVTGASHRS